MATEPEADCVKIPLWGKEGVIGHALVDRDCASLARYRWNWQKGRTSDAAVRSDRTNNHISMHREILGLVKGDGLEVDHINHNQLDNRRENLRIVDRAGNTQNTSAQRGSTSRFRGVSQKGARWVAEVEFKGQRHYLGIFGDEVEAARVADVFRLEHMPYAQPDPELAKLEEVVGA